MSKKEIRWNTPKFGKKEKEILSKVLSSGYVSEGPMTKELEERLSKIVGTKHIIMTTSGTAALYLAIEADKRVKGYSKGDVIIPDLTFVATKNAVEMAGLKPDIRDVDNDYCLATSPHTQEDRIIIPVNLLGRKGQSKQVKDNSLVTSIYDNAGCLGSDVPNGKVGCYSLQANKILSCGQGGFCATDDDTYARIIRELKDFGRGNKTDNNTKGFNFKFNDILAGIALGQLDTLEKRKAKHIKQYRVYKRELSEFGRFMEFNETEVPLWVEFFPNKKNELVEYLKEKGIEVRIPWKPLTNKPNAVKYYEECIWLPNGYSLTDTDQIKVIKEIKEFYEKYGVLWTMKFSLVHSDDRRDIHLIDGLLDEGKEFTIIRLNKNKAVGGCVHHTKEYFCVIKGTIKVDMGNYWKDVLYKTGDSGEIYAKMPHMFYALEDSIVIEWGVPASDKKEHNKEMREKVDKINSGEGKK